MPTWEENLEENEADTFRDWETKDKKTFTIEESLHRMRDVFRTSKLDRSTKDITRQSRKLHARLLLAIPVSLCLGLLVHVGIEAAGFWNCVEVAALVSVMAIAYFFLRGFTVPVRYGLIFLGVTTAVYFLVYAFDNRTVTASFLATSSFVVFLMFGSRPLDFYHEWIFAGSAWTQDSWDDERKKLPLQPSALQFTGILALAIIVPAVHSVTFAILLVLSFCFASIAMSLSFRERPFSNFLIALAGARKILLLYSAYPDTDAIHIWRYSESQASRRFRFSVIWMALAATLAIALSYCIPFEIFASWFQRGYFWQIPPPRQHHAFDWLVMPLAMMLTAGKRYAWAFVIGAVLSYVLPYLVLFTVYLPSILHLERIAEEFVRLNQESPDARTFFQRYVDMSRGSERAIESGDELET